MKFRDHRAQESTELELAPMIDVVFLLLIFFIVSWQYARFENDMDISVPSAEETGERDPQVGEIIINVREEGEIILNGSLVTTDELLVRLKKIAAAYPDQAIILRGHNTADYQHIVNVLDQAKKAGIWNIAFATTKPETAK